MKTEEVKRSGSFFSYVRYLFFYLMTLVISRMSPKVSARLAEWIGSLLFLRKRRHDFCIQNLRHAYPKKPEAEIEKIGRGSIQNMVKVIFEFIRIPKMAKKPQDFVEIQGEQYVREALKEGHGVVLAVSHFGNWELAGMAAAAQGLPMNAIGKPNKNPFIDRYIKRLRGLTGLKTIDQQGAVQKCIRLLKQNKVVAMLIDEHAKKGGVWVKLFGQKASTSGLPAAMALKYKAPVIPAFFFRETDKKSRLIFGRPFELKQTGHFHEDILENTQQYVRHLQAQIMKRPADWTLWMHNRWRWSDTPQAA